MLLGSRSTQLSLLTSKIKSLQSAVSMTNGKKKSKFHHKLVLSSILELNSVAKSKYSYNQDQATSIFSFKRFMSRVTHFQEQLIMEQGYAINLDV